MAWSTRTAHEEEEGWSGRIILLTEVPHAEPVEYTPQGIKHKAQASWHNRVAITPAWTLQGAGRTDCSAPYSPTGGVRLVPAGNGIVLASCYSGGLLRFALVFLQQQLALFD